MVDGREFVDTRNRADENRWRLKTYEKTRHENETQENKTT